jgi:hypothetical protein
VTAPPDFLSILALSVVLLSACGGTPSSPPDSRPAPNAGESTPSAAGPVNEHPGSISGRIIGADSGVEWKIGVMEFRATDPEVVMLTAGSVRPDRSFEIKLPPVKFDVPYVVVAFRDGNRNNVIDQGEDFVGGKSEAPGYSGKNLFLFTEGGTFVGDRSWDLSEIEFVIDVSL